MRATKEWLLAIIVSCVIHIPLVSGQSANSTNYQLDQQGFLGGNNTQATSASYTLEASAIGGISDNSVSSPSYFHFPGYLGPYIGDLLPPEIVSITSDGLTVSIDWDDVQYATSYHVYASTDVYSGFADVSPSGVFSGSSWTATIAQDYLFFYVTAVRSVRNEDVTSTAPRNKSLQSKQSR